MGLQRRARQVAKWVLNMGSPDAASLQGKLVDQLMRRGLIRSAPVEAAFRSVPRHPFLPGIPLEQVYEDEPVVTRYDAQKHPISSSSQPAIMALMLDMLALEPGQRVLEIGAGTGYNAALMAQMVGPDGLVVTVDIDEDVVEEAQTNLRAAGFPGVRVILGDGALGCAAFAPYDRVILTVGAQDIAPAWRDQLVEGGLLVLPLTLRASPRVIAFERAGDRLTSVDATIGGFMPLRGLDAADEFYHPLARVKGSLWADGQAAVDIAAVDAALAGPYREYPTQVTARMVGLWSGYALWLELFAPAFAIAPFEAEYDGKRGWAPTCGLADGGRVVLVIPRRPKVTNEGSPLWVRSFSNSDALAAELVAELRRWADAGHPSLERDLQVRALPSNAEVKLPPGALHLVKKQMQYIIQPGAVRV